MNPYRSPSESGSPILEPRWDHDEAYGVVEVDARVAERVAVGLPLDAVCADGRVRSFDCDDVSSDEALYTANEGRFTLVVILPS